MIGVVHDATGSAIQYFATSFTSARTSKVIEQKDKRHRRDFLGLKYMAYVLEFVWARSGMRRNAVDSLQKNVC